MKLILCKRIPTGRGWKVVSRKGWLYLILMTEIYAFYLDLGPLSICYLRRK